MPYAFPNDVIATVHLKILCRPYLMLHIFYILSEGKQTNIIMSIKEKPIPNKIHEQV